MPARKTMVTAIIGSEATLGDDCDPFTVFKEADLLKAGQCARVLRFISGNGRSWWQLDGYRDGTFEPVRTVTSTGADGEDVAAILDPDYILNASPLGRLWGTAMFGLPEPKPDRNCTIVMSALSTAALEEACAIRGYELTRSNAAD